jgi:hypothetical protein
LEGQVEKHRHLESFESELVPVIVDIHLKPLILPWILGVL